MKTKVHLFLLLIVVLAVGCTKQVTPKEPDVLTEPETFTEMVVPANFDWKTSKSVVANFVSASHISMVYVSLNGSAEPFASFYVGEGMDKVTLNVPSNVNELSVQYLKDDGLSGVAKIGIADGVVVYTVPNDSKSVDPTVQAQSVATKGDENKDGVIYYPAASMGTLMFEDLWPVYGDYDLNDIVLNYRVQLYLQNQNMVRQMHVKLRVCAVGGSLPFEIYMQLTGVKGGEIRDNLVVKQKNTVAKADLILMNSDGNSDKNAALLSLTGIKENAKRPKGGSYLNTSIGYEIPQADMVEIEFQVYFRNAIKIADLEMNKIDFFIANPLASMTEIHVRGQEPSFLGKETYEKLKAGSSSVNESTAYYNSNTNLIWAINIPEVIPHAYEGVSFIEAYPEFKTWAKSGGKEAADWYKQGKRVEKYLVK